jgi:hypothetical protein
MCDAQDDRGEAEKLDANALALSRACAFVCGDECAWYADERPLERGFCARCAVQAARRASASHLGRK